VRLAQLVRLSQSFELLTEFGSLVVAQGDRKRFGDELVQLLDEIHQLDFGIWRAHAAHHCSAHTRQASSRPTFPLANRPARPARPPRPPRPAPALALAWCTPGPASLALTGRTNFGSVCGGSILPGAAR